MSVLMTKRRKRNFAVGQETKCNRSALEKPIMTMDAFELAHLNQNHFGVQGEMTLMARVDEQELTLCVLGS